MGFANEMAPDVSECILCAERDLKLKWYQVFENKEVEKPTNSFFPRQFWKNCRAKHWPAASIAIVRNCMSRGAGEKETHYGCP